ncbi:MAG: helix-turn-helix domain-containing protein [Clostridia bacterium]|jgi:transcriptional regulator with XRE-family HTH domain|nr:helix-turn-helix domain-containing protein [Clostridia bacterium]
MVKLTSDFSNRLKEALRLKDMRPIELSRLTGISKTNLSCYMSGKYEVKTPGLKLIADALAVNPVWLMGYNVPMEQDYSHIQIEEIDMFNADTNKIISKIPLVITEDFYDNNSIFFALLIADSSMAPLLDIRRYCDFKKG